MLPNSVEVLRTITSNIVIVLFNPTDDGKFSMTLGQTFAALLLWRRWLGPTKAHLGTDSLWT